jgi:hypothetical protein
VKGWTPDGQEVELTLRQADCVRALLYRGPAVLPVRGRGFGWSVVLATAARYDAAHSCECVPVGPVAEWLGVTTWLTGSCELHNPFTGLLVDQPVQFTGLGDLFGLCGLGETSLVEDKSCPPFTPTTGSAEEPPDAREDCGFDCA